MVGVQKRKIRWAISLVLVMLYFSGLPAQAQYGGGTGEPNDPYQIATAEDLMLLGDSPEDYDKHFILTADIDLDPNLLGRKVFDKAVISQFAGVFDGNGHTISHLTIEGEKYLGLFGRLESGAVLKDLGVVAVKITSSGGYVGGLVGYNESGNVIRCYSTGTVSGDRDVGGLVGRNFYGKAINCYSSGTVSGSDDVGGLVGWNGGDVMHCYSTGAVSGSRYVGGLVGVNSSRIVASYSTGTVSGSDYVGGLVGYNRNGEVTDCYSTGAVSGTGWYIGGLLGYNDYGKITNCYSTGSVSGNDSVGGLVGPDDWETGEVMFSFWDIQTSGQASSSGGGTGKTTAEMQLASTFLEAGWDFVDETENGTEDIWWILESKDYPKLARQFSTFSPDPLDGANNVIQPVILRWIPGGSALYHDIYFGEDRGAVKNATTSVPEYKSSRDVGSESYDIRKLALDTTYYWRVDEVNEADPNSPWVGNVWSFTTANFLVVDDFEDYLYPPDEIWNTWIDGWGTPTNGSEVTILSYPDPCFFVKYCVDIPGVRGDELSMAYFYDTDFKYSEATMPLVWPRDWTQDGVGVLSLWFHGHAYNAAERMYMAIANSGGPLAVVYHDNPDIALKDEWKEWRIDLQEFATQGVNLADVDTISIGFGDKNNPGSGGEGQVFFDDIRLYRPRPLPAFSPDPQDGATDVIQSPILHWVPEEPTLQHDIYFGEDKELVANATTESPGIYRGRQPGEMTTYDPGTLEWGKTYYWRIDEVNEADPNSLWKGDVWSFTTADFILIDDFEDYNDYEPDRIFDTWIVPWDLPVNGAQVGHFDPPFAETEIVHGGYQSMPLFYDNSGPAYYSEATYSPTQRDWTEEGVGVLSLWFYGDKSNVAEPMYVALNRYVSVYHDNPDAVLIDEWTEWTIDLQAFTGVGLTNVNTISIGFGDKNNLQAGGTGLVFFDDIRLYRPPELEPVQ